ncbi:MAG: IS4 family transposase [Bacteroidota bacterium]|nr:IS4 family transposase [Bacteroidota bacterium]
MTVESIDNDCFAFTFGDKRLDLRFDKILHTLSGLVACSIPQAFIKWGQTKAAYRFLNNKKVTQNKILLSQLNNWFENKFQQIPVSAFLAIHDTTECDYTGKRSHDNLGCMEYEDRRGLYLHNTLLCSIEGVPQIIFDQYFWNREEDTLGKGRARKHSPLEEKESYRWIESVKRVQDYFKPVRTGLNTTIINICDREGDIYELLAMAKCDNSHYIVRSRNNRRLQDEEIKIWDCIQNEKVAGTYELEVKGKQTFEKRTATIQVKCLENIVLFPPYRKGKKRLDTVVVNMVLVEEVDAPEGVAPINWKLLTSMNISSFQEALKIITYYSYRWRIEMFHYILKQGCKVEDLQLEQEHNLKNAITMYSIISCRMLSMMYLSRQSNEVDIKEIGFTKEQFVFLYTYLEKRYKINISQQIKENPTVKHFTELVANLGGHMKHNGQPGIKVLWRGIKELDMLTNCLNIIEEIRCG